MAETRGILSADATPHPAFMAGVLGLVAMLVLAAVYARALEPALWWRALTAPDPVDMRQMVFHYATMPRLAVALVAGAALAFGGTLLQHVFANPLAEPGTLGVAAGSHLALAAAMLAVPGVGPAGRDLAALGGAFLVTLLVLGLAARKGSSPLTLILAGLVMGLACSMATNVLLLFNHRYLTGLFIWSSGSLHQNGWNVATALFIKVGLVMLPVVLMARPLTLLGLDGGTSRGLGISPALTRSIAVSLAAALAAFVTAAVGVLAFVGLAAPALARLSGARTLKKKLLWSSIIGAALLALADAAAMAAAPFTGEIPTGAATALLGSPLLFLLVHRSLQQHLPVPREPQERRHANFWPFAIVIVAFVFVVAMALMLGRSGAGWNWADSAALPWRAPRVIAAIGCGALLAIGGMIMQRLLANPMAAPELTGVSAGAACGVIAVMVLAPDAGRSAQSLAGTLGALAVLALMTAIGGRAGFAPERMILAGVALTTALSALVSVLLASGDPRLAGLMTWMAGSTYRVGPADAAFSLAAAAALIATLPFFARWLDIVPLGEDAARALGVKLPLCRFLLMLAGATASAVATLVVGPLTFVGLLAPHLARAAGIHRALPQVLLAALAGAAIMVLADWLGRQAAFPRQIPAGLMATAAGGPVLLWLLWRNGRAVR